MAVPKHQHEGLGRALQEVVRERNGVRAEVERLRAEVMRQWAEAHYWLCRCEDPDTASCGWPVPIKHTMPELRDAIAHCQGESAR